MIATGGRRIVVATTPVDFRRGMDSRRQLGPIVVGWRAHSAATSSFFGQEWADRVKILAWDGTGLWLFSKAIGEKPIRVAADPRWSNDLEFGTVEHAAGGSRLVEGHAHKNTGARTGVLIAFFLARTIRFNIIAACRSRLAIDVLAKEGHASP